MVKLQVGDIVTLIPDHPSSWRTLFPMWETGMEIEGVIDWGSRSRSFKIKGTRQTISDYNVVLMERENGPW